MHKRLSYALLLIGLLVIVLVMQSGKADVNLIFTSVRGLKAFVYLGFAAVGVAIGALLK